MEHFRPFRCWNSRSFLEIMLAHRARQRVDAPARHGVFLPQFPPAQMEQVLVAVDVVEKERRPFPTPVGKRQCPPAAGFVDDNLAGLDLGLSRYDTFPNTRQAARSRDSLW